MSSSTHAAKARNWPLLPEQQPPPGAKAIRLTKGWVAWVDEADYAALSAFNWYAECPGGATWYAWYASRTVHDRGKKKNVRMHRLIVCPPDGMDVDHQEHRHLVVDNRRSNLRFCTNGQNVANARKRRNTSSRFRGVYHHRAGGWAAQLVVGGVHKYLGYFAQEHHAALAFDYAARKFFGEFARTNFPAVEGPVDVLR